MKINTIAVCAAFLTLVSCSSAPKRPPEVFTNRNAAAGQLEMGNRSLARSDYVNAHIFFEEAWKLAVSTDDPESRMRVRLAWGNAWYNQGNLDKARSLWQAALDEATESGYPNMAGAARIYLARGTLAEGNSSERLDADERKRRAETAGEVVRNELSSIRGNDLYLAFAWKVLGLAEKELGNFAEAESAIGRALDIHEKGRYLEDAAYDWYLIASVRSKAGNTEQALQALDRAIGFDRRAENANGLGMSWMAKGLLEQRRGDASRARAAYERAHEIFRAAFIEAGAEEARRKLESLGD